jgi:outer membrane lipoprotein-sorting protein
VLRTLGPVNVPPVVRRHPSLRWLAPIAVVGVAGLAATGMFRAQATSEALPETSPAALIAAVQAPASSGFSGTVVSRLSLGLPELPALGTSTEASMASMLAGSHTLQVWYGGADQQRIALLGETDETDLFRNGRTLWQWTSADRIAVHTTLPAAVRGTPHPSPTTTLTPSGLAQPTTAVRVGANRTVANRSAYELVLTPRTAQTRVGSVHISVDGRTKVPLGVQVYARDSGSPSIDVAYTSIRFGRPPSTYFKFQPPSNATVRRVRATEHPTDSSARPAPAQRLATTGSGWSTVWTYRAGAAVTRIERSAVGKAFTRVSGSWGKGRLLTSDLVTVLVTDDGRVLAGAVDPNALYAAAK